MMKNPALERLTKVTDIWTPRLVIAVIVAAFILSYAALLSLAIKAGYHPWLAWLWPLTMDGVIVITSLNLVKRQMRGDGTLYVWLLLILFDGASIYLNGNVAQNLVFATIHALPPLTLVLVMKLYTNDIKDDGKHAGAVQTLAQLTAQIEQNQTQTEALAGEIQQLEAKKTKAEAELKALQKERRETKKELKSDTFRSDDTTERAMAFLSEAYQNGTEPTGAELGRQLERSEGFGRRLKRELWPQIVNSQNGANSNGGNHV